MSDGRFFSVLMVVYAVVVVGLLLLFNWAQKPEGLDRQLITTLLAFLGPFGLVLLNNMANSKQAKELKEGQQKLEQVVNYQGQRLENKAADIAYTASELAREKGKT